MPPPDSLQYCPIHLATTDCEHTEEDFEEHRTKPDCPIDKVPYGKCSHRASEHRKSTQLDSTIMQMVEQAKASGEHPCPLCGETTCDHTSEQIASFVTEHAQALLEQANAEPATLPVLPCPGRALEATHCWHGISSVMFEDGSRHTAHCCYCPQVATLHTSRSKHDGPHGPYYVSVLAVQDPPTQTG